MLKNESKKKGLSLIWIGGFHSVKETLESRPEDVFELWVEAKNQTPEIAEVIRRARALRIPVHFRDKDELFHATKTDRHQGLAARAKEKSVLSFSDFLGRWEEKGDFKRDNFFLVALDQIQDPHNLGAIARSASVFGARGLIICDRRSASVSLGALRSSAGALEKIPLYEAGNLGQALASAKKAGFWIYGAAAGGRPSWESALNSPMILVIGSEGEGLRKSTQDLCDELVGIPISESGVSSLNASVAAGILMYEVYRRGVRDSS